MKKHFLLFLFCGMLVIRAKAQPALAPAAPQPAPIDELQVLHDAAKELNKAAPETGWTLLLQAADALDNTPPKVPELGPNMTPTPPLVYERAIVAQQNQALKLLRAAFQKEIVRPAVDVELGPRLNFLPNYNGKIRHLARVLDSESRVRAADLDYKGALDSRLDCLQLSILSSGGSFINMMTGGAIEEIGRFQDPSVIAHLDAQTCRAAAARLTKIEAQRPSFAEIVQAEKENSYKMILPLLTDAKTRQSLLTPEGRKEFGMVDGGPSEAQAREFLALTPTTLRRNIERVYDTAIENAKLPFQAEKAPLPQDIDFITDVVSGDAGLPGWRFIHERNALQTRLLKAAFELRAIKLETGAYPVEFEAGIHPFSLPLQPLVYNLTEDGYLLYSVGPDGKDDGGAKIQTVDTDENGKTIIINRLTINSTGDISAPVFE